MNPALRQDLRDATIELFMAEHRRPRHPNAKIHGVLKVRRRGQVWNEHDSHWTWSLCGLTAFPTTVPRVAAHGTTLPATGRTCMRCMAAMTALFESGIPYAQLVRA